MAEDAVTLITRDHREMERLFEKLRKRGPERERLCQQVVALLQAHSRAEEEHVYPAVVQAAPGEKGEVHHGKEEHEQAERLAHRLLRQDPDSPEFDRVLAELVEAIEHHVREEETEVLPTLAEAVGRERLLELGRLFGERRRRELEQAGVTIPSARRASEPTRAELYQVAQERGIEGRSKMTKEELRRALGES